MRIRPLQVLVPVILAGTVLAATPTATRAANGMIETGTTTYEVIPAKNAIQVTVKLSIYNAKPDLVTSTGIEYYFWNGTDITVENEAGPVSATSDAGGVSQSQSSSDKYYRYIHLTYPNVYYGQTRVVTVTYTIPAAPHAAGGFRAGQAYASLCAVGNGWDTGTLSIVLPAGFQLFVDDGGDVTDSSAAGDKQVYSTGTTANPYKFWTCVDAEDAANLTHTPLTASGQSFDLESWPEDASWSSAIRGDVASDVQTLEALTGLKMPGGTVSIMEAGDQQLGEYGGLYNPKTRTASIPETVQPDTVAHELAHIWFNPSLLQDKWMMEGLAGYSEQAAGPGNYTACADPGPFPGSGPPDLETWQLLNNNATTDQQNLLTWQYAASCYLFTSLADSMGKDNFRAVLAAASAGEMAYIGATPAEKRVAADLPISARELLDLIDERGMVAAGKSDLDAAQRLMAQYGLFDQQSLDARSSARSTYHSLAVAAGTWRLPDAIRDPMSSWQFDNAQGAMATATEILAVRDAMQRKIAGLSLDGTDLQKQFEGAASPADLANLLVLIKKEADAADKLGQATRLRDADHSLLQSIGLLGTDLNTPLKEARTDIVSVKPDQAGAAAQSVIDRVNGAVDQGLLRGGGVLGLVAVLLLLAALLVMFRRRRPAVVVIESGVQAGPVVMLPPGPGDGPAWPPAGSWQPPAGSWRPPEPLPDERPNAGPEPPSS